MSKSARMPRVADGLASLILTGELLVAFVQRMIFDPDGLRTVSCVCHEWHAVVVARVCAHMRKLNFLLQEMVMACFRFSKIRRAEEDRDKFLEHMLSCDSLTTDDAVADVLHDTGEDRFFARHDTVEEMVDRAGSGFRNWCDSRLLSFSTSYEAYLMDQKAVDSSQSSDRASIDSMVIDKIHSLVFDTAKRLLIGNRGKRLAKMFEATFGIFVGSKLTDRLWQMCHRAGVCGGPSVKIHSTRAFCLSIEVVDVKDCFVETTPMHDALRSEAERVESRLYRDVKRMSKRLLTASIHRFRDDPYMLKYLQCALERDNCYDDPECFKDELEFQLLRQALITRNRNDTSKRARDERPSEEADDSVDLTVLWPYFNAETPAAFFALANLFETDPKRSRCELCNAEPYRMAFWQCTCDRENDVNDSQAWLCAPPPMQADGRLVVAPTRCMLRRCLPMSTMISLDDTDEHGYPLALRFNLFQTVPLLCQERNSCNEQLPFYVHTAATEFNSEDQGGVKWANLPSHEKVPRVSMDLQHYPKVAASTLAMTKHLISLNREFDDNLLGTVRVPTTGCPLTHLTVTRHCLRALFEEKRIMRRYSAQERSQMLTMVLPNPSLCTNFSIANMFVRAPAIVYERPQRAHTRHLLPQVEAACDRMHQEAMRAVNAKRTLILAEEAALRDLLAQYAVRCFRSATECTSTPPWLDTFIAEVVAPFSTAWRRWDASILKEPIELKILEPVAMGLRAAWPRTTTLYQHAVQSMMRLKRADVSHESVFVRSPPQTIHELMRTTSGFDNVCEQLAALAGTYTEATQSLPPTSSHAWHWITGTNTRARVDTMLCHLTTVDTIKGESRYLNSMAMLFDAIGTEAVRVHATSAEIEFSVAKKPVLVKFPWEEAGDSWGVEDIFASGVDGWEWNCKSSLELLETLLGAPETRGVCLNMIMSCSSRWLTRHYTEVFGGKFVGSHRSRLVTVMKQHGITRKDLVAHVSN